MSDFNAEEFMEEEVTRVRLVRLTKPNLFKLVEFCEAEVSGDAKKNEIINALLLCLGVADVEAESARRERLSEKELERKVKEMELLKKDREEAKELAKLELERAKVRQQENQRQRTLEARFDLNKCFALMPKFSADQVDVFFDTFERIARERQWPKEEWVTLVSREFTGKAQEAYVRKMIQIMRL